MSLDWGNAAGICPHGIILGGFCGLCALPAPLPGATRGWECPKCGHVYSPSVATCWICPQQAVTSTVTPGCTCGTSVACPLHMSVTISDGTFSNGSAGTPS
jgi:hypothetical protein